MDWTYGGFPWLNGKNTGHLYLHYNGGSFAFLAWEDRAVRFYGINSNTSEDQLDVKDRTYLYFALGVEE